jgi:hypothetical protein
MGSVFGSSPILGLFQQPVDAAASDLELLGNRGRTHGFGQEACREEKD